VVGRSEGLLPIVVNRAGGPEMHRRGSMPPDPGMAVNVVILIEEFRQKLLRMSH